MSSELLQQVRLLDPISSSDRIADVLIVDGIIQAIEEKINEWPTDTLVRDCQGLVLGPGLVDLYSHSGEPGFEDRETLASLMQSAAAGGFTRVAILPDTKPAIDNPAVVAQLRDASRQYWGRKDTGTRGRKDREIGQENTELGQGDKEKKIITASPRLSISVSPLFWGALTLGVKGQQMTELAELSASGIVGFADGQPIQNLALLRRLLEYIQPLDKPVMLWPASVDLTGDGVIREGSAAMRFGLRPIPEIAETAAMAALLEVVAYSGTPVHIMRVSTAGGVQMLKDAKRRGLPVTASTTWMHLLLNTEDIASYDPNLRLQPPLGNPSDQAALIQGLKDGVIDAIAIDHTPYTYEEKTVAFAEAPPGAIGLELALPLLWHHLVDKGIYSAHELWRYLSIHPTKCLQQKPAAIAVGQVAELTLFAPQETWTVSSHSLKSRSTNTPWLEQEITGRVKQIWPKS